MVKTHVAISLFALLATKVAWAQTPAVPAAATPAPAATPADPVQSPEVHPDRTITLRLRAPKAVEVTVAGEWTRAGAAPNSPEKLRKDAQGIWSVTIGPVEPNVYIYVFNVDGVTITDPVNPLVKLRARTSASMVEVPGEQPWEFRDVPHGAVEIQTHTSGVLGGAMRQIFVYTPPGYDRSRATRYPVLYLLHGNNDLAAGWTMAGKANLILDNLIAGQKAVPMIVVMPWGHALPFGSKPPAGQPSNNDVFQRYLLEDVVPLVEARYRTAATLRAPSPRSRGQRAIFGLSMGGAQALQIGLARPELFGSVGVYGSGMNRVDFDARYKQAVAALAGPKQFALFYLGMGKEDGGLGRAKELAQALTAHGVPVTYREVDGGHTYPVWRKLLVDSAPLLFQSAKAKVN